MKVLSTVTSTKALTLYLSRCVAGFADLLLLGCIVQVSLKSIMYTVFQKTDAKIQITMTTAYRVRIKYPLSGFNYHLSGVNVANFNKIHLTVNEQQLFLKWNSKTEVSNMENTDLERSRVCPTWKTEEAGISRASPAYSVHFLKICHGVGRRVGTWNYRTDVH